MHRDRVDTARGGDRLGAAKPSPAAGPGQPPIYTSHLAERGHNAKRVTAVIEGASAVRAERISLAEFTSVDSLP